MWRIVALLTLAGSVAAHDDSKDDASSSVPSDYESVMRSYAGAGDAAQPADASRQYMNEYAGKFIKKYAGDIADFAHPGTDGMSADYQHFMDKGDNYQHFMKTYGDSSKYFTQAQPKDSSPSVVFLAEADDDASKAQAEEAKPTAEQKKAEAAEEAQAAEHDAAAHARRVIKDLRDFAAKQRSQVKSASKDAAESIASDVHADFDERRKDLQQKWHSDLKVLDPSQLAGANWSDVKAAMDSLIHVRSELDCLDHSEAAAVRHSFEAKLHESKRHARALGKEARKAAHAVNKDTMRVEGRRRAAGARERDYEREQEDAERLVEGLEGEAESASDSAEEAVEEKFQLVEGHLERHMEEVQHAAEKTREERKRAVKDAARAVAKAHKAAHEAASSPGLFLAAAPAESSPATPAEEAASAQKEEQNALAEARRAMEELDAFAEKEHQHVRKASREVAELIQSKVHEEVEDRRQMLEQRWRDQLNTLSSGKLAAANQSEMKAAVEDAAKTREALQHLDEEEEGAVMHTFKQLLKGTQMKVHTLGHSARGAAEEAQKLSWKVQAHQEAAGVQERLRERSQQDSEREAEDLQDRVETAADKAQQAVEEKYQLVEGHLEKSLDAFQEAASTRNLKREQAEREAVKKMSEARAKAAKKEQSGSESAPPAVLLAAAEEASAAKAGGEAEQAKAAIEEIHAFAAKEREHLKKGAEDVVGDIESKVHQAFQDRREALEKQWHSSLEALDATELAEADEKHVENAVHAADEAEHGLRQLGHDELRALRHAFRESREAQKAKVRSMARSAKEATKGAKAAKEHGEKAEGLTEGALEALEEAGEAAEEKAQDVLEEKFEHIERAVEKRIDDVEDKIQDEHEQRRKQLRKAEKAVEEARHEAKKHHEAEKAEEKARHEAKTRHEEERTDSKQVSSDDKSKQASTDDQSKEASGDDQSKKEERTDSKQASSDDQSEAASSEDQTAKTPGVFLAQTSTGGLPLRTFNFYVVAAVMAGLIAFAGLRHSCPSRHVAIAEHPALG